MIRRVIAANAREKIEGRLEPEPVTIHSLALSKRNSGTAGEFGG
jgi:hypothetical protein